jgi:hypothetical protein
MVPGAIGAGAMLYLHVKLVERKQTEEAINQSDEEIPILECI